MKATEFVKRFGIMAVIHDFSHYFKEDDVGTIKVLTNEKGYFEVNGDELKRLVESHELVNHMGGLEKAMDAVINQEANGRNMTQLAQAIADVEACKEN